MAQQPIELILARQLAGGLSVAALLIDADGDTIFFNEAAERFFGRRLEELDELPFERRTEILAPRRDDGSTMSVEELPGSVAMREARPAHASLHMHGLDGVLRPVEATAVPLESPGGGLVGALVLIWPQSAASPGDGSA